MSMNNVTSGNIPIAGLISIGLIALIEVFFFKVTEPLTGLPLLQPTADDAVVAAKHSFLEEAENKIVIVGDSSSLHGLMPSVMANTQEFQYLNLGTLASLTTLGYSELAIQTLRHNEKPTAILFSVLPQTMEIDQLRAKEMGQLSRFLSAYGATDSDIYSVSLREKLSWMTRKHRFNLFPPEFGGSYQIFEEMLHAQGGYLEEKTNKISRYRVHDKFISSSLSMDAIELLVNEAQLANVPLMFLFNPKPKSLVSGTYLQDVLDFKVQLKEKFPSMVQIQPNNLVWDDYYFGTETHLNIEGAKRYSAEVSALVSTALQY